MVFLFRALLLGLGLAGVAATAAAASDYVVVASSNPAIARGQTFDSGGRLALPMGQTLTLMHASGTVFTVKGAAGGVLLPRRPASSEDADRLATLRFIIAPADRPAQPAPTRIRTRGGVCPLPAALTSLNDIRDAVANGCPESAGPAFDAWLAAAPREDL